MEVGAEDSEAVAGNVKSVSCDKGCREFPAALFAFDRADVKRYA